MRDHNQKWWEGRLPIIIIIESNKEGHAPIFPLSSVSPNSGSVSIVRVRVIVHNCVQCLMSMYKSIINLSNSSAKQKEHKYGEKKVVWVPHFASLKAMVINNLG